jgi:UDP-N-acetylmuramate: L-alanyl-gamma-D-glutamyl-meso-diaminopimelate ligase
MLHSAIPNRTHVLPVTLTDLDAASAPTLDIYLIAIGGTGMAPLACLLQEQGHRVRGTDGPLYPPMSTLLEAAGVRPEIGWDAGHLSPRPDLVVVGNAVRRDNPEVVEAERLGIERLSMPEALARFFLAGRRPLVIAGTHGKTTTTALAAWVYTRCGRDPGYLVGGVPKGLPASFHTGTGERFAIEGDEYNASFFDRGAKFLHYRPETLILTSVEYDHADLYPSPEALRASYRQLIALLPPTGCLIACGDDPHLRELAREAPCPVILYGLGSECALRPLGSGVPIVATAAGSRVRVADPEGEVEIDLRLAGEHNVANALGVWAAARRDGLPAREVAAALASFEGVKRRLEDLGTFGASSGGAGSPGITVVDDFAHHPTAVEKTLGGLAQRYPNRRLIVLFEPRSLTAGRSFFYDLYKTAFTRASRVLFAPTFHAGRLSDGERLDFAALAADLERSGVSAAVFPSNQELLAAALAEAKPGDVLVTMSSGAFEGMPGKLATALGASLGRPCPDPPLDAQ